MTPRHLLRPGEREQLAWLEQTERRAILPLRVAMLFLSGLIWLWAHGWVLPSLWVFLLFYGYAAALGVAAYFLLLCRLDARQIRPFCVLNLIIDGLFVAGMCASDLWEALPDQVLSDYHIFFFLLVLRGYAVLERRRDIAVMNALVLVVFTALFLTAQPSGRSSEITSATLRALSVQAALIMLVMGLSWFLLGTLNRQRTELQAVRENLLRLDNLATLGEIVAGVAHEINNPVGIISAYADFLLKKAGDREELAEDFRVIRSEAERCQQIVSQLLSFANPNQSATQEIDLAELNDEVLRFLFLDKRNNLIDVQAEIAPDLPPVSVDPIQVKQALLNIYMNARHAMGEEGRIEIEVCPDPEERRVVRLTIRDSGPGIPEEALERLFEPFYSSKASGSGLGLAITRRIVETHGGTIEAENEATGGAVFTIRIPAAGLLWRREPSG